MTRSRYAHVYVWRVYLWRNEVGEPLQGFYDTEAEAIHAAKHISRAHPKEQYFVHPCYAYLN